MYCAKCGNQIGDDAQFCPVCGAPVQQGTGMPYGSSSFAPDAGIEVSPKSWIAALLLEIFLGVLGIHRFYVGKIGTGIIWLLTAGIFGIGWVVDLVMIACGNFKDKQGRYLKTEEWKQLHVPNYGMH